MLNSVSNRPIKYTTIYLCTILLDERMNRKNRRFSLFKNAYLHLSTIELVVTYAFAASRGSGSSMPGSMQKKKDEKQLDIRN